MKTSFPRSFSVTALLLVAALAAAPAAHAQFGIAGGANFNNLSDIQDDDDEYSFDNSTGYHIGAFYDFTAGPISVRPGVFYMDVGSFSIDGGANPDDGSAGIESVDYDLSLIEVPIDVRYRIAFPFVKPYVTAGPAFRFVTDDGSESAESKDFSVAGNAGLGVDFGLPLSSIGFFLEGRYTFGLSSIAEFEALGAEFTGADDSQLNNFMLRAGVKF